MPKLYLDWLKHIKRFDFSVVALAGDEKALLHEAILEIRSKVLQKPFAELNHEKLDAKTEPSHVILDKAMQLPMMASKRLIEIEQACQLKADALDIWKQYIEKPSPSTVLVLIFNQIDLRLKFPKLLEEKGLLYRFDHPKPKDMPLWIQKRASYAGLQLHPEAIPLLEMVVGIDLLLLDRALEKLRLACDHNPITADDVEAHVVAFGVEDAFVLARAILANDGKQVFDVLSKLQQSKEAPLKILGLIAWQIRQVAQARALLDEKHTEAEIGKKLGLFGERLVPVLQAAKRQSMHSCIQHLSLLKNVDTQLKTSSGNAWLYLENTLIQILL